EFLTTRSRATGLTPQSAVIPGKINLNTIWDVETFLALCDPQAGSYVSQGNLLTGQTEVQTMFAQMARKRTPGLLNLQPSVGPNDSPFLSLASTGYTPAGGALYPAGAGIRNTVLRGADGTNSITAPRIFQKMVADPSGNVADLDTNAHPYLKYEMLTK